MKKWSLIATGMVLIFTTSSSLYAANNFQPRGHIKNDRGQNCTYTQTTDHENGYFFETLMGRVGTITFDDPKCMSGLKSGFDINKMLINNIIVRPYSHSDAAFKTRVNDLYPGSMMQKRGYCIQSSKYPGIGVTVDYEIYDGSIVRVRHGASIQGCTR